MKYQKLFAAALLFLSAAFNFNVNASTPADIAKELEGRWDLVIQKDGQSLPSWLEIEHSGNHTLVGRFVYAFGSARPIAEVKVTEGKFSFSIPPQWEPGNRYMDFEGELVDGKLKGTMIYTDGKSYSWTGERAPLLKRTGEVNGTSLLNFSTKLT